MLFPQVGFILLGDWGLPGYNQSLVANQMAIYSAREQVDFIVALGDNFYTDGVKSDTDPQWQNTYNDVYKHPFLQVPWYAVLGK